MVKAGEKLQESRLEKGLSLEEISQNTKIKTKFLEYIENGEYSKLPSVSYASGFVRNYAKFLGLNEKEILALFRREFDDEKVYRVLPKSFEAENNFPLHGIRIRQTFFVLILVFIIFLGYIIFQYRYAFTNPPLSIVAPKINQVITSSEVQVIGNTDSNSTVYVNKTVVSVDGSGNFNKTISVFPGSFTIDIKSVNRFGKISEIKRIINVKPAP